MRKKFTWLSIAGAGAALMLQTVNAAELLRGHSWDGEMFVSEKENSDWFADRYGKGFDFDDNIPEALCGVQGVKDLGVKDGKLKFTTTKDALLYIGNFFGYELTNNKYNLNYYLETPHPILKIRLRQSRKTSTWQVRTRLWCRWHRNREVPAFKTQMYKDAPEKNSELTVSGTDWQTVSFCLPSLMREYRQVIDSLGISSTDPENTLEIDWIKLEYRKCVGFYRKTIVLEDDPVSAWLFLYKCFLVTGFELYVNGQFVAREKPPWDEERAYDCQKLLTKGKNVIALRLSHAREKYLSKGQYPFGVLLNGDIMAANGKYENIALDSSWKTCMQRVDNWNQADFDDSNWKHAGTRPGSKNLDYVRNSPRVYRGPIKVKHGIRPDEEDAFFRMSEGVKFAVELPQLSTGSQYEAAWKLTEDKGRNELSKGHSAGKKSYEIAFSPDKLGVYKLHLDLFRDGKNIDSRVVEFVVVGNIKQKETEGRTYEDGLDLRLVDEIDCGNPDDPHPFTDDGQSKIVQSAVGNYRITGKMPTNAKITIHSKKHEKMFRRAWGMVNHTSWYSYILTVEDPLRLHLVEVTYPDDAKRQTSIKNLVSAGWNYADKENVKHGYHIAGVGATTGGAFLTTGKMKTLKYMIRPMAKRITFDVSTVALGTPAAVASMKIYEIENDLPAAKIHNDAGRTIGLYTEGPKVFRNAFSANPLKIAEYHAGEPDDNQEDYYHYWYEAIEQFMKYMKFSGQNLFVDELYMFCDGNVRTFRTSLYGKFAEPTKDFLKLMVVMFEENVFHAQHPVHEQRKPGT